MIQGNELVRSFAAYVSSTAIGVSIPALEKEAAFSTCPYDRQIEPLHAHLTATRARRAGQLPAFSRRPPGNGPAERILVGLLPSTNRMERPR